MPTITFAYPVFLVAVLLLVPMLWLGYRRRSSVGHTQTTLHDGIKSVPLIGRLPTILLIMFWVAACLALARPQLPEEAEREVIITRDFVIATDISGSMTATISDPGQIVLGGADSSTSGANNRVTRLMVAERAIELFVQEREGDRVALFLFDTQTYYSWPLSKDLRVIELKNRGINRYNGGGTDFASTRGPIQAAINHFKELGQAQSKVLIMVTDGEDSIPEKRYKELLEQMTRDGIKIYTIGVGESWTRVNSWTRDLERFTEETGGIVIKAGDAEQMRQGFALINELERSTVEIDRTVSYRDIYQFFLMGALALGLLYLGSSVLVREDA